MMSPLATVGRKCRVVLEGRPNLRCRLQHVLEGSRHHADHGIEIVVELNLAADDRPVAGKLPPPQSVTQDDDLGAFVQIIRGLELFFNNTQTTERAKETC